MSHEGIQDLRNINTKQYLGLCSAKRANIKSYVANMTHRGNYVHKK